MSHSPDDVRAALLLTNRLVSLDVEPLTAREFWQLVGSCAPGDLLHAHADVIAERLVVDRDEAERMRSLLDAVTALGFEEERLRDGGVELVSAIDDRFPDGLRERLGSTCPPFLLVAGPIDWLSRPGLGVVGSRDAGDAALAVTRDAARMAVEYGWPVVSGLARGVDQVAMNTAHESGGTVVGVPAEGILTAARSADVRGRVHAGELCIASPYAPSAPFRAGNAMGRNKIVYGLSRVTFVVAAAHGTGGTWAGAKEALDRGYSRVAVWNGEGVTDGNHALIERGATGIDALDQLFELDRHPQPVARAHQTSLF